MHDGVFTELGTFREVARPPTPLENRWMFQCPSCGLWAYLDDDQWHGRESAECSCGGYHETHDYAAVLAAALESV